MHSGTMLQIKRMPPGLAPQTPSHSQSGPKSKATGVWTARGREAGGGHLDGLRYLRSPTLTNPMENLPFSNDFWLPGPPFLTHKT